MITANPPTKQYFCYCLKSSVSNRTYVGASVNPEHRLKQHNGFLSGGAKYTKSNRPWELKIVVSGFSTWKEALQFEWRWKKTRVSRKGISPFERREKCLNILLSKKPWVSQDLHISN